MAKLSRTRKQFLMRSRNFTSLCILIKDVNLSSDDAMTFFDEYAVPKLSYEQQQLCEGLLSVDKCYNVLNTFKNNKAPGNDGLTAEFYKQWWHLFGVYLVNSLNASYYCVN